MRIVRLFFIFALALIFNLNGSVSRAATSPEVMNLEHSIESRLTNLVRGVDPMAVVSVKIHPRTVSAPLPMTPYRVDHLSLPSGFGSVQIGSTEIMLMLSDTKKGDYLTDLIKNVMASYDLHPQIKVSPLPEAFVKDFNSSEARRLEQHSNDTAKPVNQLPLWINTLGWGGTLLILMIFLLFNQRSSQKFLTAVQNIKAALENPSLGLSQGGAMNAALAEERSSTERKKDHSAQNTDNSPAELSVEGQRAVMSDAYWAGEDRYAAWFWSHLKPAQRQELIAALPFLADYGRSLSEITPRAGDEHLDVYYLSPLPIDRIDQGRIQQSLKNCTGLYGMLPELRKRNLTLSVRERLALEGQSESADRATIEEQLTRISPSEPRKFHHSSTLVIRDESDELELLQLPNIDLSLVKRAPSLIWLELLPQESVTKLLAEASARDLAMAWVGPEEFLSKLRERVPDSKRRTLEAYLGQIKPTRESQAFYRIHRQIVTEWEAAFRNSSSGNPAEQEIGTEAKSDIKNAA